MVEGEDAGECSSLLKGDLGGETSGSGARRNGLALCSEGATAEKKNINKLCMCVDIFIECVCFDSFNIHSLLFHKLKLKVLDS